MTYSTRFWCFPKYTRCLLTGSKNAAAAFPCWYLTRLNGAARPNCCPSCCIWPTSTLSFKPRTFYGEDFLYSYKGEIVRRIVLFLFLFLFTVGPTCAGLQNQNQEWLKLPPGCTTQFRKGTEPDLMLLFLTSNLKSYIGGFTLSRGGSLASSVLTCLGGFCLVGFGFWRACFVF